MLTEKMQRRPIFCLGTLLASAALGLAIAFYLAHIDWPASPDAIPPQLERVLDAREVTVHTYDLGGFIDTQYLWRIAAERRVLGRIIQHLGLMPVGSAPRSFWSHPPSWRPARKQAGVRFYKSPQFDADNRGSDGDHYFAMHDEREGVLYVWFKQNF
jgi:hypothetical protein